jgi:hypothetical protein
LAQAGGAARGAVRALDAAAAALADGLSVPEEAVLAMATPTFPAAMLPLFGGLMWWARPAATAPNGG